MKNVGSFVGILEDVKVAGRVKVPANCMGNSAGVNVKNYFIKA